MAPCTVPVTSTVVSGDSWASPVAPTTSRASTVVSSVPAMVNASGVITSFTSAERVTCSPTYSSTPS